MQKDCALKKRKTKKKHTTQVTHYVQQCDLAALVFKAIHRESNKISSEATLDDPRPTFLVFSFKIPL